MQTRGLDPAASAVRVIVEGFFEPLIVQLRTSTSSRRCASGSAQAGGRAERTSRRMRYQSLSRLAGRPGGLPDPRAAARRPADRLPRLGGDLAEAGGRDRRRWTSTDAATTPTFTAASTRWPRRPTPPSTGARARVAAFTGADPYDDLHPERDRGDQPRGLRLGPGQRRSRRRGADHPDGAPLQHRPLAAAAAASGAQSCATSRWRRRRALARRTRRRAGPGRRQARRLRPRLQRARDDQPGRRDRRACPARPARCR